MLSQTMYTTPHHIASGGQNKAPLCIGWRGVYPPNNVDGDKPDPPKKSLPK